MGEWLRSCLRWERRPDAEHRRPQGACARSSRCGPHLPDPRRGPTPAGQPRRLRVPARGLSERRLRDGAARQHGAPVRPVAGPGRGVRPGSLRRLRGGQSRPPRRRDDPLRPRLGGRNGARPERGHRAPVPEPGRRRAARRLDARRAPRAPRDLRGPGTARRLGAGRAVPPGRVPGRDGRPHQPGAARRVHRLGHPRRAVPGPGPGELPGPGERRRRATSPNSGCGWPI